MSLLPTQKSSQRNAGEKAVAVLEKMTALSDAGILKGVKADRVSYNTVIHAYAKSADPMSCSVAESVFRKLECSYKETNDETLKPNIVTYSTLLNALANCGKPHSAKRAEESFAANAKRLQGRSKQRETQYALFQRSHLCLGEESRRGCITTSRNGFENYARHVFSRK